MPKDAADAMELAEREDLIFMAVLSDHRTLGVAIYGAVTTRLKTMQLEMENAGIEEF